jgi:hypothetical protein
MVAPLTIRVLAVILTGIALAPALAHAFEFPGKRRLERGAYVSVQGIYYPGFTLLGIFEPAALLTVVTMLLMETQQTVSFWLTLMDRELPDSSRIISLLWKGGNLPAFLPPAYFASSGKMRRRG